MVNDERIIVLTADLGYGMFDNMQEDFPDRFINVGAREQLMLDMAIGLSYQGYIPFCYSITPFLLYRPFETIRTYIDHESINVKLIGGGRDKDYLHDGFSHDATDDLDMLAAMTNLTIRKPYSNTNSIQDLDSCIQQEGPWYINLKR
jgi:transketolase